MVKQTIVVLNGVGPADHWLDAPFSLLQSLLNLDQLEIQYYLPKEIPLAHCPGCFGCWIKTPGVCVAADKGREIVQSVSQSDMLILLTPVTFGGYSATLKQIVDRLIPLMPPLFRLYQGEIHHAPRYRRYPRWWVRRASGDNVCKKDLPAKPYSD